MIMIVVVTLRIRQLGNEFVEKLKLRIRLYHLLEMRGGEGPRAFALSQLTALHEEVFHEDF